MLLDSKKLNKIANRVLGDDYEKFQVFHSQVEGLLWRGSIEHKDFIKFLKKHHYPEKEVNKFREAINELLEEIFQCQEVISGPMIRDYSMVYGGCDGLFLNRLKCLLDQFYDVLNNREYAVDNIKELTISIKGRVCNEKDKV